MQDGEILHLVAGESCRYSIRVGSAADHLADTLRQCDGRSTLGMLLQSVPADTRPLVSELCERLRGERVLVEGSVDAAEVGINTPLGVIAEGSGTLVGRLHRPQSSGGNVHVLCQDTLDYHAALQFNERLRGGGEPWLWVTTGPMERGFVSPVFFPRSRPCLQCLLRHFQRLSPVPYLYDALAKHGAANREFARVEFSEWGLGIVEQLVRWKAEEVSGTTPLSAVHRLHVLELETMEITSHRVFFDPWCPECSRVRMV